VNWARVGKFIEDLELATVRQLPGLAIVALLAHPVDRVVAARSTCDQKNPEDEGAQSTN
jgi:hypothetical protein